MKNKGTLLSVVLVFSFLLGGAGWAGAERHEKKEAKSVLADLKLAAKDYKKYARRKEKARREMETDSLSESGRRIFSDQLGTCQGRMNSYRAEAMDDMGFLKAHWEELTGDQKESARNIRDSMNDARGIDEIKF